MTKKKISTESYKGVRDFYPEDQFIQRYMIETMARVSESYGYEEYNASILESSDLYKGKTSEEIVNEQTYFFKDRGGREVTLRPEMTPTIARMVAAKKRDLAFPLRWYSIPNVFRYERMQKGRLREHWQLNADIFLPAPSGARQAGGFYGIEAEVEIIALSHRVMTSLGASESDFEIHVSDRRLLEKIFTTLSLTQEEMKEVMKLLDKRGKIDDFDARLEKLIGNERAGTLTEALSRASSTAYLEDLVSRLLELGVSNIVIDTSVVRGFEYYTGMVFEVFDTSPENSRSLFGGGRYDNLLEMFGTESVPAVGFGMGDVTARDFLEVHDLLPEYTPATELVLCVLDDSAIRHAMALAENLRDEDVTVAVNYSLKRAGDQIKYANKLGASFVICIGDKEIVSDQYTIKHLASGQERTLAAAHIADHMFSAMG
jgi:histidyl-tRNA synthetase